MSKFSLTLKLLTRQSRSAVLLPIKASDSSSSQGRALSVWAILFLQQTENSIRNRLCHTSDCPDRSPGCHAAFPDACAGKAPCCPQPTTARSLTESASPWSLLRAQVLMVVAVPRQGMLYVLLRLSQPVSHRASIGEGSGRRVGGCCRLGPLHNSPCVTPMGSGGL